MDANRMKAAAEWLRETVFKEEPIPPRAAPRRERLPSILQTARSLENGRYQNWQSREVIFLKQGKLLAGYEDEYDFRDTVQRYYPTYETLSDRELRGYFSWRTQLRRGNISRTWPAFAFLYIYELLNQIGAADPMDGYRRLVDFRDAYGQIDACILPYLERWLVDYVVYYGLDAELLSGSPQAVFDQSVAVLERIQDQDEASVIRAVKRLAPKWLERSRFYGAYEADMDAVIVRVLRRMSAHYAARCRRTMVEQYFGGVSLYQVRLFDAAVFCDPLKRRSYEYSLNEQRVYVCGKGLWTVRKRAASTGPNEKLDALLKTIDAAMRREFEYRYEIKSTVETKWIVRTIQEESRRRAEEKRAAGEKKLSIDYAQLNKIRRDAAITQERLVVEEEEPAPPPEERPVPPAEPQGETPLSREEYRLLQCLLYGGDTGWVQASGCMLSVLADGINEKLYDIFQDSVLDGAPQLVEDYIDDLKEMVRP